MRAPTLSPTSRMIAVALVAAVAAGFSPVGADTPTPPTNLKQVGDHWTAWDSPTPGENDYIIERGDTLWDLAAEWLDDPYLWPQIWDENRYILDSHWIYPGDPLVRPDRPVVVPDSGPPPAPLNLTQGDGSGDAGLDTGGNTRLAPRPLELLAVPSDLYCSGFITPTPEEAQTVVAGQEIERRGSGQGDVIYLNRGRDWGMQAGDELQIRRAERDVLHPETGVLMGTFMRRLGRARVLAVRDTTSIAVIDMACDAVFDGDELVEWQEIPVPQRSDIPPFERYGVEPSGGPVGTIVTALDNLNTTGEGQIIAVDLGALAGARPGDVMTLYRENGELPRLNLGQAVVLTTEAETAIARINVSVREAIIGDRVEIVR